MFIHLLFGLMSFSVFYNKIKMSNHHEKPTSARSSPTKWIFIDRCPSRSPSPPRHAIWVHLSCITLVCLCVFAMVLFSGQEYKSCIALKSLRIFHYVLKCRHMKIWENIKTKFQIVSDDMIYGKGDYKISLGSHDKLALCVHRDQMLRWVCVVFGV